MTPFIAMMLIVTPLTSFGVSAHAQTLEDIFTTINPYVVVVRSRGRDVGASGVTRIKAVAQDSMASKAGLASGDKIVTIGGKELAVGGDVILSVQEIPVVSEENIEKIRSGLAEIPVGTPFKMAVLRAGKVAELTGTAQ